MRVLHLAGSPSDDFHAELSRLYAADAVDALGPSYDHVLAHVSPDGSWRFPASYAADDLASAPPFPLARALTHLAALHVDVALPQLFCRPGMTTYRALLAALAIPFVGNTAAVMAVGADKAWSRAIVAAAGVAVPAGTVVRSADVVPPLPVVVKPVDADNSEGVTLVRSAADYPVAVAAALAHSATALVETYVELGRGVRCGVLERDGVLVGLPLEEYAVSADKPIRDRADKLARSSSGELYLVAKDEAHAWIVPTSDPATEVVWAAAFAAYRALGCRHYGLFDFRLDPDGRPWFLEAGLYCSFARTSVVAVMAAAAGIPVGELFADTVTSLGVS